MGYDDTSSLYNDTYPDLESGSLSLMFLMSVSMVNRHIVLLCLLLLLLVFIIIIVIVIFVPIDELKACLLGLAALHLLKLPHLFAVLLVVDLPNVDRPTVRGHSQRVRLQEALQIANVV